MTTQRRAAHLRQSRDGLQEPRSHGPGAHRDWPPKRMIKKRQRKRERRQGGRGAANVHGVAESKSTKCRPFPTAKENRPAGRQRMGAAKNDTFFKRETNAERPRRAYGKTQSRHHKKQKLKDRGYHIHSTAQHSTARAREEKAEKRV